MRTVTFEGTPLALAGPGVTAGMPAPAFTVLANDLSPVTGETLLGSTTIVISVPSLDTPVCDTEARRFNKEIAALDGDVSVLCVSMDLPFAQARWCGSAGVDSVTTVSDHRDASFGEAFGVLIPDLRLLARAVFITDTKGIIRYAQLVPEITDEPDYGAVLSALKSL